MCRLQSKGSLNCALPPTVTATAMLHAGGLPRPTRGAPPLRGPGRASWAQTPTAPPVPAPLPSKPKKKAVVLESGFAAVSNQSANADAVAGQLAPGVDTVTQPLTVCASRDSLPAALPSASGSESVPEASSSAAGQSRSSIPEADALHGSLHTFGADQLMAGPNPALTATDSSQQQQQPEGRTQLERPVTQPAAVQACSRRDAAAQPSRPSTSGSKPRPSTSSFDRRLALLHKGLPSHLLPPSAANPRPASKSCRASAPSPPPGPPTHHPSAELRDPTSLLRSHLPPTESTAAVDTAQQGGRAQSSTHADLLPSKDAALHPPEQHASAVVTPSAPAQQAGLGKGPILSKPSSPTSVLPSQGLGDTTYHSFHGLAEAYPELYKAAAAAGRAQKTNSRALQCFVGETLKGNPDLWRQQLKSAYTMCNDRLKHDAVGNRKPCPPALLLTMSSPACIVILVPAAMSVGSVLGLCSILAACLLTRTE